MSILIFDLEGDGLLDSLTKIHCIAIQDYDTKDLEVYYESPKQIKEGLFRLYHADKIVGHNIIGYDVEAIRKIYPKWTYKALDDTFILSCILHPLRPSHSIESYSNGAKVANENWECLTHNMLDRCVIDTLITTKIYEDQLKILSSTKDFDKAVKLEYRTVINHRKQVKAGVDFDIQKAEEVIECLDVELDALKECINSYLPSRCVPSKSQYKKIFNKDGSLSRFVLDYFNGEVSSIL